MNIHSVGWHEIIWLHAYHMRKENLLEILVSNVSLHGISQVTQTFYQHVPFWRRDTLHYSCTVCVPWYYLAFIYSVVYIRLHRNQINDHITKKTTMKKKNRLQNGFLLGRIKFYNVTIRDVMPYHQQWQGGLYQSIMPTRPIPPGITSEYMRDTQ